MNKLSEIYQNLINEKKERPFEKGCLMAKLEVTDKTWNSYLKRIKKEDLYIKEGDSSYGLEDEPHVTILYGFDPKYCNAEINDYLDALSLEAFEIEITKVDYFNNEDFNVLKFSISSPKLSELNKKMKDNFDYENDYPDYKAHATIAYLNKDAHIDSYIEDIARASGLYTDSKPKLLVDELVFSSKDGKSTYKLKK
jgi:2'-5' RNA ligase